MTSRIGSRVIRWTQKKHRKQCRVYKNSFSATEAGKNLHIQFQRVFFKPVKIYFGIITQAPLVPQKRREWQIEPSAQWKKEQRSHQCKVDCQKKGVTVRWNAIVTCATCTIKWPMARQHSRRDMVSNLTDHPCQETMIAGNDGLQESEASEIYVKRFTCQEVFVKECYEFSGSWSSKTVIDSRVMPRARRWCWNRSDNKGSNTEDSWYMSGEIVYRHHEELRLKLYDSDNQTFPIPLK